MTLAKFTPRQIQVAQLSARIFGRAFSPEGKRTGEHILRKPLIGKQVVAYWPEEPLTVTELKRLFPRLDLVDLKEEGRLDKIESLKQRGKPPTKKFQGKRANLKKK
ncbi:hypothetical protein IWQ61_005608 [Dispira simplex]|nr:hypothetical protein IWQ61_005608 [Dispira simplex]